MALSQRVEHVAGLGFVRLTEQRWFEPVDAVLGYLTTFGKYW